MQNRMKGNLLVYPTSRAIREHLGNSLDSDGFLDSCLSIGDFFALSISTKNKTFISQEKRFLILQEAAKEIDLEKLAISSNFENFLKQSEYIFRFFDELSAEEISIEKLKEFDIYEEYIEHITLLERLFNDFCKLLDRDDFVDRVNLSRYSSINHNFLLRYNKIEIFLYSYLSKYEYHLLKQIAKDYDIDLIIETNRYNIEFINELFKTDFKEDEKIVYNLSTNSIISSYHIEKLEQKIVLQGVKNQIEQIGFIKKSIYDMIKAGVKAEKITVVLPDESFVQYLEIFDKENYFNFAMGRSIKNSHFYKRLSALVEFLNNPLIKEEEKLKFYNFDILRVKNSLLPQYKQSITKESLELFLSFLGEFDVQIKEKIDEILYKLEIILFGENKISLSSGIKLFINNINEITLDDVGGGKITVMGLLETRGIAFDGVIIVDFNDNKAPKKSIKDRFVSSNIKSIIGLPIPQKRESLQKFFYKSLISKAKIVNISFVDDEQNIVSRFANELLANTKIEQAGVYTSILYTPKKLYHINKEYILNIDLSKQVFSATSLKDFLECKRRYLFKYIYKLKEHNISLMPKAYEMGSLLHKILQNLFVNNPNLSSYMQIKEALDIEIEKEKIYINNIVLELELELYRQSLYKFAYFQEQRFKQGFWIGSLEKRFEIIHRGIKLQGIVDRVDIKGDIYEIIDYKSSRSLKIDTLQTYKNSTDFQLEFYFLAYRDKNPKTYYYDINKAELLQEVVLEKKLELLDDILDSLYTKEVNFEQTDKRANCEYCAYKTICGIK